MTADKASREAGYKNYLHQGVRRFRAVNKGNGRWEVVETFYHLKEEPATEEEMAQERAWRAQ